MDVLDDVGLGGLAALGTLGSVCAVLLRSTHQNLKTLETLRREAATASERLRDELRDHDDTIFQLQGMCSDYRFTIARLEAQRDALQRDLDTLQAQLETTNLPNPSASKPEPDTQ